MRKNFGFSLIEILIALIISVIILLGINSIFLSMYHQLQQQLALNSLQEKIRVIAHVLSSDIQNMGYIGCSKLTEDFPLKNFIKIANYQDPDIKSGSDAMTISYVENRPVDLVQSMQNYSSLFTTLSRDFSKGDRLIINDCKTAELFTVENVNFTGSYQNIIPSQSLQNKYSIFTEVNKLEQNTYFVANTSRKDADGNFIEALFLKKESFQSQELIEGVIDMKIKVAVLTDGKIMEKSITQLKNNENVVAVSLQLTVADITLPELQKTVYIYAASRE